LANNRTHRPESKSDGCVLVEIPLGYLLCRLIVGIHLYDSSLDLSKELSKEESNEESEASEEKSKEKSYMSKEKS